MRRLEHNGDTLRLQHLFNRVGDLRGQAFLDLKPLGISLNDPRKFGDTHDADIGDIGNPGAADDWRDVMFAVTFKWNTAENDHLVIAVCLFEGLLKYKFRVLAIAGKIFLKGTNQTTGSFPKAVTIRVFANPAKDLAERMLDLQLRRYCIRRY